MATRPPLYQGTPRSSRKPYERQGRKRTVVGNDSIRRSKRIKVRDNFTCQNKQCNVVTHQLQVDHKVPVAYGGEERDDNCQCLCIPCHKVKSALEAQGLLLPNPSDYPTQYSEAKAIAIKSQQSDDVVDAGKLFTECQQLTHK